MPKLLIVGGAYTHSEIEKGGAPLTNGNGQMLRGILRSLGVDPNSPDVAFTNVFSCAPPRNNNPENFCGSKNEGVPGLKLMIKKARNGRGYLKAEYAHHLTKFWRVVNKVDPNLILALGDVPLWALKPGAGSVTKDRGAYYISIKHPEAQRQYKVLTTFAPDYITRVWKERPLWYADLNRVKREMESPELEYPKREIWVNPELEDLEKFRKLYIFPDSELSVDIETGKGQITEIGFAPDPGHALVIPFVKREQSMTGNYWRTLEEELQVWRWVKIILNNHPSVFGQNFTYDLKWLWQQYGIAIPGYSDDTMILSHAQQPELKKSLGFLSSIFSDEGTWKHMRKEAAQKRED